MGEVPPDTLLAIELLTEEAVALDQICLPLKSQVYSLVPDKTLVEKELDALKKNHEVRLFALNTDRNDVALILSTQHDDDLYTCAKSLSNNDADIITKFKKCVTDKICDDRISTNEFRERMELSEDPEQYLRVVRLLQSQGFLIDYIHPNRGRVEMLQIWSPRIASVVLNLNDGRKEILSAFRRLKHREMTEIRIFKLTLRKSKLSLKYHIRDLLGLGLMTEILTPAGKFYRLTPKRS